MRAPSFRAAGRFRVILSRNLPARLQQLRIAPDMLIPLFLGQIAAVKILRDSPATSTGTPSTAQPQWAAYRIRPIGD